MSFFRSHSAGNHKWGRFVCESICRDLSYLLPGVRCNMRRTGKFGHGGRTARRILPAGPRRVVIVARKLLDSFIDLWWIFLRPAEARTDGIDGIHAYAFALRIHRIINSAVGSLISASMDRKHLRPTALSDRLSGFCAAGNI